MNKKRLWKRWVAFVLVVCIWITNPGICCAEELVDSIVQPQEEILEEEDTLEYEVESEHLDISEEIEEKTEEEIEIPEILEEPEEIETPVEPMISDEQTESLDELLISESGLNIEEESLEGIITVSAVKAQTYTGKALTPTIIVKDAKTKKRLKRVCITRCLMRTISMQGRLRF